MGIKPTGRTFKFEFEGKEIERKEYRSEFVNMPYFRIKGTFWAIPESKITEVKNEYR